MSVVPGPATIASASAVRGGRPETDAPNKTGPQASAGIAEGAIRMDASFARIVERLQKVGDPTVRPVPTDMIKDAGPHSRFVDAVQALRLNEADASRLTPTRIAELKSAAREVFSVTTGIPRAPSPIEVFEEQQLHDVDLVKEVRVTGPEIESTDRTESDELVTGTGGKRANGSDKPSEVRVPELPGASGIPGSTIDTQSSDGGPTANLGTGSTGDDAVAGQSDSARSAPEPATTRNEGQRATT